MEIKYSVPSEWYEGFYKDEKEPCKAGRSFSIVHEDKVESCVLLIHGYTGYPGEMTRPATDLYKAGLDVYVPRLPGHGTSGKDFLNTSEKDWVGVAEKAAISLSGEYSNLYVLGHSMGGGISAIVSSRVKEVKKLVLACPAVASEAKKLPARPGLLKFISFFRKTIPTKWQSDPDYVMYYENAPADDLYLGSEYWSKLFPKELSSLFKIMLDGGKALKDVQCQTLAIGSENDRILGTAPINLIKSEMKCPLETLILKNASHYLFYDKDKAEEERAVERVVQFLKD